MGANKKINIAIIVISTIAVFLQTLILSISEIYESKIALIVIAVLNAAVVAIETLQLNLKKIKSARSSRSNSINIERSSGDAVPIEENST